jgi:hypothetical protein
MNLHPVQNTSVLMPVSSSEPLPGQVSDPPPPVEVDGDDEFLVEQILDARVRHRRLQFLVKWRGYDNPDSNTWEPEENVAETQALEEFEAQHEPLIRSLRSKL